MQKRTSNGQASDKRFPEDGDVTTLRSITARIAKIASEYGSLGDRDEEEDRLQSLYSEMEGLQCRLGDRLKLQASAQTQQGITLSDAHIKTEGGERAPEHDYSRLLISKGQSDRQQNASSDDGMDPKAQEYFELKSKSKELEEDIQELEELQGTEMPGYQSSQARETAESSEEHEHRLEELREELAEVAAMTRSAKCECDRRGIDLEQLRWRNTRHDAFGDEEAMHVELARQNGNVPVSAWVASVPSVEQAAPSEKR